MAIAPETMELLRSPDPNTCKTGIVILARSNDPDDLSYLQVLAAHSNPEISVFATKVMRRKSLTVAKNQAFAKGAFLINLAIFYVVVGLVLFISAIVIAWKLQTTLGITDYNTPSSYLKMPSPLEFIVFPFVESSIILGINLALSYLYAIAVRPGLRAFSLLFHHILVPFCFYSITQIILAAIRYYYAVYYDIQVAEYSRGNLYQAFQIRGFAELDIALQTTIIACLATIVYFVYISRSINRITRPGTPYAFFWTLPLAFVNMVVVNFIYLLFNIFLFLPFVK